MKTKFTALYTEALAQIANPAKANTKQKLTARNMAATQCLQDIVDIRKRKAAEAAAAKKLKAKKAQAKAVQFTVKDTFNVDVPEGMKVAVYNSQPGHTQVPQIDPNYVFKKEYISDLFAWLMLGDPSFYATGPTGSGKTSFFIEAAARLSIPLYNVVGHNRLEVPELIGGYKLNDKGGMDWVDGPLTLAARNDAWFLLDEGDLIDPSTLAGLNGITEGRPFTIPETGELVVPGPNYRFILTANSNGSGDATGLYQGVLRMNIAFLDRFYMSEFDYQEAKVEEQILEAVAPAIPDDMRKRMVMFANEVRGLFIKGEVEVTLSTRTLSRWARLTALLGKAAAKASGSAPNILHHTFDRALGFRAEPDTRRSLHEVIQRHFGV